MNRFIIAFTDNRKPVGLNSMKQVNTYLERSVPDVDEVMIYEQVGVASRNAWKIEKVSKRNPAASKLVSESIRSTNRAPYSPWSNSDINQMIRMRRAGSTGTKIAMVLGRTPAAVYNKLSQFNVKRGVHK